MRSVEEGSYSVFFEAEENYLQHIGTAKSDHFGRQSIEDARTDAQLNALQPLDDSKGMIMMTDFSQTTRHEIDGESVYFFTYSMTIESEGESKTSYHTFGNGNADGNAVFFSATSANRENCPSSILAFLESVTFNEANKRVDTNRLPPETREVNDRLDQLITIHKRNSSKGFLDLRKICAGSFDGFR